ncbi:MULTISPECIES: tyrosine-type recombinase/integrase [unclassified Shinella]|uniref:tyrosine-type recombinase/integrase n=1 Tax=unclassified Shinella TaxID=2643062 RepID=UPI00225D1FC5|nr:integrase arm-type DNA-binding domain-containing protein [Shinella sp. YE25]MDC7254529.1 tyrosine-type recombinase/integrase [Shinella sp. YE25]CAI0337236.1 Integrase [Rhizobiaceae bacterium]CAK7255739.1 Integrase [Shinella sp. WSC3-e]
MALTDLKIRQAKTLGKDYTLNDSDGLSLFVATNGVKSWHYRYVWAERRRRISFGTYPELSLQQARALRDGANAVLAAGTDPQAYREQKKRARADADENTFRVVYKKWFQRRALSLKEGRQTTLTQIRRVFAKDVLPKLGKRPILEIRRHDLLAVVDRIERRGAFSVADKVRTWLRQMFRFALVVVPDMENNPASDLDAIAAPLPPVRHNPYLLMDELPSFLRLLRNYPGVLQTQLGLRLLLLTGVRTGEVRLATPDQFHLDKGLWIIPPEIVKQLQLEMRKRRKRPRDVPPYIVPLSVQAVEVVRHMLTLVAPTQRFLFPHAYDPKKQMSENTLNAALKRLGYKDRLTGHGIRATISTALNEIGYPKIWVDAQLSHADPDKVSSAYNHAEYVEPRRRMMQDWADRLDLFEHGKVEKGSLRLPGAAVGLPFAFAEQSGGVLSHSATEPAAWAGETGDDGFAIVKARITRLPAVTARPSIADAVTDAQRERLEMLELFNSPCNLSVVDFAKAVGKSRQSVNYDVRTGKLLALTVGNLGRRIPDWHLDPLKDRFIRAVLMHGWDKDGWQIYRLLKHPYGRLKGRSPIDAVVGENFHDILMAVCLAMKEKGGRALRRSA